MEMISCILLGLLFNQQLDDISLADTVQNRFKELRWGMEEWEVEAALRVWVNSEVSRRGGGIWSAACIASSPRILFIRPDLRLHLCYQSSSDTNDKWVLSDARLFRGAKLVGWLPGTYFAVPSSFLLYPGDGYQALIEPFFDDDRPKNDVDFVQFWIQYLQPGVSHEFVTAFLRLDKPKIVGLYCLGSISDIYDIDAEHSVMVTFEYDEKNKELVLQEARFYRKDQLLSEMKKPRWPYGIWN